MSTRDPFGHGELLDQIREKRMKSLSSLYNFSDGSNLESTMAVMPGKRQMGRHRTNIAEGDMLHTSANELDSTTTNTSTTRIASFQTPLPTARDFEVNDFVIVPDKSHNRDNWGKYFVATKWYRNSSVRREALRLKREKQRREMICAHGDRIAVVARNAARNCAKAPTSSVIRAYLHRISPSASSHSSSFSSSSLSSSSSYHLKNCMSPTRPCSSWHKSVASLVPSPSQSYPMKANDRKISNKVLFTNAGKLCIGEPAVSHRKYTARHRRPVSMSSVRSKEVQQQQQQQHRCPDNSNEPLQGFAVKSTMKYSSKSPMLRGRIGHYQTVPISKPLSLRRFQQRRRKPRAYLKHGRASPPVPKTPSDSSQIDKVSGTRHYPSLSRVSSLHKTPRSDDMYSLFPRCSSKGSSSTFLPITAHSFYIEDGRPEEGSPAAAAAADGGGGGESSMQQGPVDWSKPRALVMGRGKGVRATKLRSIFQGCRIQKIEPCDIIGEGFAFILTFSSHTSLETALDRDGIVYDGCRISVIDDAMMHQPGTRVSLEELEMKVMQHIHERQQDQRRVETPNSVQSNSRGGNRTRLGTNHVKVVIPGGLHPRTTSTTTTTTTTTTMPKLDVSIPS
eukprot:jgi/Bigna1/126676/aug1.3_g1384